MKKLHPVFKQAKKAESMRLIKKIRFLKTKDTKGDLAEELAELEAQLKLLSAIELHALGASHLRTKLKKHHSLKHATFPEQVDKVLPITPTVPASSSSATPALISKAENRLCSAKNVADAVKTAVPWILSEPGATLSLGKKETKAKPKARVELESSDESDDEGLGPVDALDSDDEAVLEEKAADEAGWESGSVGGEGSDDDDDDKSDDGASWESGSVASYDGRIAPPSDSESDAPPPKKVKAQPAPTHSKQEKQGKADGSSSMFLPSLAAGFTVGDGDSDPDDDYDESGTIGTKKAERKNRRGQRARQAIWEKKYGKGAKHVVKAREEAKMTEEAKRARQEKKWANQAGFMGPSKWSERGAQGEEKSAAPAAVAQVSARPSVRPLPKAQAKEVLHPSWEAARLRKMKEQAGVPADAPKPTKIVFD